jgi:hypothetical protein
MNLDLIEHFKLDAQVFGEHTLHIEYVSDPARGIRKARIEKRWDKERYIGHGAFGDVWLEVQKERGQVAAERAVKSIQKRQMESVKIDYRRELLALAKLSRVCGVKSVYGVHISKLILKHSIKNSLSRSMDGTKTTMPSFSQWNTFHMAT